jgi:V/A-type H+-transporting ATPase subunit E
MDETTSRKTAAGIEELIARLRQEGVDEGKAEAERIVAEAEERARRLLDDAETRAEAIVHNATKEAERQRAAGEEALVIAMRDAVLELKQGLAERFAEQVRGLVSEVTRDEEMLKRMVLAVAARAREESGMDDDAALEIALPRSVVGLDDLRRNPEELREGSLTHFAAAAAAEMLRQGVTFVRADDRSDGIRVRLVDSDMVVDLTDDAVAEVILRHLQPRFRALLENVVR